jgi:hypothetical protein
MTTDDASQPGPAPIGGLPGGGQLSAGQPYSEAELDQYGVPVPPPPKGRPFLVASSLLACAALQVYALVAYLIRVHPNQYVPIGLRMQSLGAGLIGLIVWVVAMRMKPPKMPSAGVSRNIIIVFIVVIVIVTVAATVVLLIGGLIPRGLAPCHVNCGGD